MTESRRLGASHLHTPKLCLGGNVFGWTADKATSFAVLDAFADAGGTLVDTADVYSAWVPGHKGGESETVIGEWLKSSGRKMGVATKVGMLPWTGDDGTTLSPAAIAAACDASLRRLGVEQIALYYAHRDDEVTPQEAYMEAFAKLVAAGKVATLGASNFHAARLKSANDIARKAGAPHFQALQPEYNLLSRHAFEGELQDYCVEHNIGVLPYYGLASGYLTGKYRSADDFGKSVRGGRMQAYLDGKGPSVLAAMDEVVAETGATLAQIALAWLAAQPGVTAPIASATSVRQLEELLPAMDLALTPAQLEKLDAAGA
ncbi:MAG: aldo/keto reductase [Sphingomonas sp.]|uniref:aldo/keto reductase n=1 Tax=Sphingomonas sp. TaxID=28214 RepID=UPI001AD4360E|nr:aldo/keto reductase [Sphingomonas sp.]MBN8816787.1 aldo/keto reductase [Sphingomonas sp.]